MNNNCIFMNTKRYKLRKSPPYPANKCRGMEIIGNDKRTIWKSVPNKNNIYRWVLIEKSPKRKSPKRKSPKRKSPKRKSPKRKSPKRKSPKRKSLNKKIQTIKCPDNKILNPKTGRCVLKSGKIGKALLVSNKKVDKKKISINNPAKYNCVNLKCAKKVKKEGWNLYKFPKNYFLYSSQSTEMSNDIKWYGDKNVAIIYETDSKPCNKYVAKKDLLLLDISNKQNIYKLYNNNDNPEEKLITEIVGGLIEPVDLFENYGDETKYPYVSLDIYTGNEIPKNFLAPSGYYSAVDKNKGNYLNKRFAPIPFYIIRHFSTLRTI